MQIPAQHHGTRDRSAAIACVTRRDCPATQRLGTWRLNKFEASALHAIACLQSGLIGDAWTALARVSTPQRAVPA